MRIALISTDNREHLKKYDVELPILPPPQEALLSGFAQQPGLEVHFVSCLQKMPVSSPTRLADNIFYHPLHVPSIGWMKTGYQGCIRAVRRLLRKIQPDIVHGQGTERECAMCAVFSGFPNVLTLHGVMSSLHGTFGGTLLSYHQLAKILELYVVKKTDGVVCISSFVQQLVKARAKTTWLVPNAIRDIFLTSPPATGRRPGPPRLLNVGTIYPLKQQVDILESVMAIRSEMSLEMTFVGALRSRTAYSEEFSRLLTRAHSKYGGFRHIPYTDGHDLLTIFDEADALLHFSKEESFGLIFAEALARNLPMFASDVGAIREITSGVQNCRIFDPSDFEGLIEALRTWIGAECYLRARPSRPNADAESRFHPRVIAAKHLEIYRAVLNRSSSRF